MLTTWKLLLGLLLLVPTQAFASTFFDTDFETCAASPGNDWPCEDWNDFNSETICTTNRLQVLSGTAPVPAFTGTKYVRLTYNNVSGSTCQPAISHNFTASNHIFLRTAIRQSVGFQTGSNGGSKRIRWRPANTANNPNPSFGPYPIFWLYNYFGAYAVNIESPYDSIPNGFWLSTGIAPTPGGWDQVELEIIANTPGSANGGLRIWINNVLRYETLNRQWFGPTPTSLGPGGLWHPSDWFSTQAQVFLQSGVGTVDYDRLAVGNTRIGVVGTPPPADTIPPSTTTLIASASGGGQGNPSWSASTDNVGVQGYELLRCTGASCTPTALLTTTAANTLFYTDLLNISPSTIYGYIIRAFDAAGNRSPPSAIIYITTTATFKSILASVTHDVANNTDIGAAFDAQGPCQIVSNRVRPTTVNTRCFETYNAVLPGADQWGQRTISTLAGAQVADVCVPIRASAAAITAYMGCAVRNGANTLEIREITAGTPVVLQGNSTYTLIPGSDQIRMEGEATALKLYLKRSTGQEILAVQTSDATIATGRCGLSMFVATGGSLANVESDDTVCGDFGAGTATTVGFESASNSPDNETSNTTSWPHVTNATANPAVIGCAYCRSNIEAHCTVSSFTLGGQPLVFADGDTRSDGAGSFFRTEAWRLFGPSPGSATATLTFAGIPQQYGVGSLIGLTNVSAAAGVDATAVGTDAGTGTALSAAITTVADHAAIVDCALGQAEGLTVGAGQVERVNRLIGVAEGTRDIVGASTVLDKTPAGAETENWTQSSSLNWAMSAVSVVPATVTPVVPPTIASIVLDATGMTITPGATVPTRVRIAAGDNSGQLSFSDNVLYTDLTAGRYNQAWADGFEFACAHPIDSAGVENIATNPDAWQCDSLIGIVEPLDTTAAVLSGCLPTTDLPAGTTNWTITCNIDKSAAARFGETDAAYDDLAPAAVDPTIVTSDMTTASLTVSGAITGLTNGSTHTYYVRSQFTNSIGDLYQNSASTVVTVTVASSTADTTPPSTVAGLACDAAQQAQVPCVWGAATDNVAVSSYNLYLCGGADCTPTTLAGNTGNVTQTVLNLAPLTPYGIGIKALDSSNNESAALSNIEYKTTTAIVDLTPPSKMMNLRVTEGPFTKSVRLGWDGGTDNQGPVTATIEQCTGVGCSIFAAVKSDISTQQLQVDLTAGTLYRFRGIFTDQAGNRSLAYSNILDVPTATTGLSGPRPTVPFGVERPLAGERPAAPADRIPRP